MRAAPRARSNPSRGRWPARRRGCRHSGATKHHRARARPLSRTTSDAGSGRSTRSPTGTTSTSPATSPTTTCPCTPSPTAATRRSAAGRAHGRWKRASRRARADGPAPTRWSAASTVDSGAVWQHRAMAVHDVAARGFGDRAEQYEQARPSYAADAVAWLVEQLGIGPGATVCDLAAGTGKLTRLLVPAGGLLLAVEPVEGMRTVLHRALPAVPAAAAVAEALPFADGALDAVTVAQAFHWFDPAASLTELHRALRAGGRLGLL